MIDASIAALPDLWPIFLALALPITAVVVLGARQEDRPTWALALFAVSVAGVLAVTLSPGQNGDAGQSGLCESGLPLGSMFSDSSTRLNVLLFIPSTLFAVRLFRRPLVTLAVAGSVTGLIELIQAEGALGRACSYDDLIANLLGALLGVVAGTLWSRGRHRGWPITMRDTVWGVGVAAVAGTSLTWLFHTNTTSTRHDARRETQSRILAKDESQREEWLESIVTRLYGKDVQAGEGGTQILRDGRLRLTLETNKGNITAIWPDRTVTQAWSTNNQDDHGALTPAQMRRAGEHFARSWFGNRVKGARETFGPINTKDGAYHLGYRRYRNDVMMPLRIDITVTTSGRIMGFTAQTTSDPRLPPVTVSSSQALSTARKLYPTGKVRIVQLLAQRVGDEWRPAWMIATGGDEALFLDAVTGKQIHPQQGD
ncbi:VanZ family protein [Streptomyces sp. NPDC001604]|uniref:VanZ family protein n=1 Tax=Streptomyces sp. NPDC001604 TaxID=3364593 RepID=UPI0036CD3534